jgi:uroporphyrinogen decarboxylase
MTGKQRIEAMLAGQSVDRCGYWTGNPHRDSLPGLIELGVDLLHPIQALATGMDAESLRPYRGRILFVGGIDVQQLLVHGTPQEVAAEVRRVTHLLGPLVISPSHEAILSDVPPANIETMARAARAAIGCRAQTS